MTRRTLRYAPLVVVAVGFVVTALAVPASAVGGRCVGGPGCSPTVQSAIDAASAGDTIHLGPGVFPGGVTIAKPLTLVGSGTAATVIRGGGPVVSVTPAAAPGVTLTDLTITGGVTHGADGIAAFGGGIDVAADKQGHGSPVVLRRVAVTGNRATPTSTTTSQTGAECTHGECPFAIAGGGGIATNGDLTLDHVTVSGNAATGPASDADGGGVWSDGGRVTVLDSVVSGNRAEPTAIGRFAEGGGLFVADGPLSIARTTITGNTARLVTAWPVHADDGSVIEMNANSGGIHVGDGVTGSITGTTVDGNTVSGYDPVGEPVAFDGGMFVGDSDLSLRSVSVSHNAVDDVAATSDDGGFSGDALEFDGAGELQDVRVVGNTARASSPSGSAQAANAIVVFGFSPDLRLVTGDAVVVQGNTATASSPRGRATVLGAGILNDGTLTLSRSIVSGNSGLATGARPTAQGGGIWNGVPPVVGAPVGALALHQVVIKGNAVAAPKGTAQGGGIYSTAPFTADHVVTTGNVPDNCSGTGC